MKHLLQTRLIGASVAVLALGLLALSFTGSAQTSAAIDWTGTYAVTGTLPEGPYAASARVTGGPVFQIEWTIPHGDHSDTMQGVGFVEDGLLIVGFIPGPGVMAYRVVQGLPLTLEARWTVLGVNQFQSERMVKGPPAIRAQR